MLDYQLEVIDNVKSGYVGNLPGKIILMCLNENLRAEFLHSSYS